MSLTLNEHTASCICLINLARDIIYGERQFNKDVTASGFCANGSIKQFIASLVLFCWHRGRLLPYRLTIRRRFEVM